MNDDAKNDKKAKIMLYEIRIWNTKSEKSLEKKLCLK